MKPLPISDECCDLTDDEILERNARLQAEAAKESELERARKAKQRKFHFSGGMC